jgi:glycosyltransferase involved in cell wall biosynthesis
MTSVSVITATYNSAGTLEECLQSVAGQTDVRIEHLIIDGGSTDATMSIVGSFPHVSVSLSEHDEGIYDAMNKGIRLAQGDIIGILNSDDLYPSPDVIHKVVRVFEETGCDAVYGDLVYVDRTDTGRVLRYWRSGPCREDAFHWGWMPPHPTFFVRRSVYEVFGVFDLQLGTAADYELMLRLIHKHRIKLAYIPEILVNMRSGGASNLNLMSRLNANRADRKAWRVNGLRPYWFTLYLKPLRKVSQFILR